MKQMLWICGRASRGGDWTDMSIDASVQYDPFGDGVDKNAWADTYTTTSTNPLWKMTGF